MEARRLDRIRDVAEKSQALPHQEPGEGASQGDHEGPDAVVNALAAHTRAGIAILDRIRRHRPGQHEVGREPDPGEQHVDQRQVLTQLVGGEPEQDHRQQGDGHADRISGLLADLAGEPDPERDGGNGDHQQGDHCQRHRALRPEDVFVVIDQHRFHDGDRGAVGEPGDQEQYIRLIGENVLQGFGDALPLGLLHRRRFACGEECDQQGERCQETKDGCHAHVAGGAGGKHRHERQGGSRPEDGADHRKSLLPPGDAGALVVILADLGQHGVIRNVGERINRAEEYVREQRPPELAGLCGDARVAEHEHEGDPERDGEEQDVRSAPPPACAGVVRKVTDERVDGGIPDLADQQRRPSQGCAQAHLVGEEVQQPE